MSKYRLGKITNKHLILGLFTFINPYYEDSTPFIFGVSRSIRELLIKNTMILQNQSVRKVIIRVNEYEIRVAPSNFESIIIFECTKMSYLKIVVDIVYARLSHRYRRDIINIDLKDPSFMHFE